MQAWYQAWPEGTWRLTTDAKLPTLQALEWSAGQQRLVNLLDGWT